MDWTGQEVPVQTHFPLARRLHEPPEATELSQHVGRVAHSCEEQAPVMGTQLARPLTSTQLWKDEHWTLAQFKTKATITIKYENRIKKYENRINKYDDRMNKYENRMN